tara:strand:+ start:9556 stop:11427 length:1872 start_codon:yes stop_codon:yes gene_type:complete
MDYTASQFQNTITSKSTLVPSDNQLTYKDGETVRFSVPPFMSFIDPRQSVLKMRVKVTGSSIYKFPTKIGCQSIINNMRIMDGTQTHTLENLTSYAERLSKEYHYTENDSIKHKRDLLEGSESVYDEGWYSLSNSEKNSAAVFNASQLGNGYSFTQTVNTAPETQTINGSVVQLANPNEIEVVLPLSSGIIGTMSKRMFPAALTQGLAIEIDTNLATKCLEIWNQAGIMSNEAILSGAAVAPGAVTFLPSINNFAIKSVLPSPQVIATPVTEVSIMAASVRPAATAPAARSLTPVNRFSNSLEGMVGASNLIVGRPFYAWTIGSAVAPIFAPDLVCIGTIGSLTYDAANNAIKVGLGTIPANLQSLVGGATGQYVPVAAKDFIATAATGAAAGYESAGACGVSLKTSTEFCSYELKELELVLKTAQPPKSYVDGLQKSTMTDEGAEYDFMTTETYRNNVNAGEVVAQINLPTLNERAVSIITLPHNQSTANSVLNNNFKTTLDNISNYGYIINGQQQPTRVVNLGRLSNPIPMNEQVALWELEKSLATARLPVRNLQGQAEEFMMARPLAKYGGVYNLAADGNISLKMEFSTNPPPSENKLLTSYVYGLRRIRVNKVGLSVEL